MQVLAFAAQKGGSGKTTLAANIAVEAERRGDGPVALIDTDRQGSLADWCQHREAGKPLLVQASMARLAEHVDQLRERGIKLLVIDTPPAITSTIGHAINVADLVVIRGDPAANQSDIYEVVTVFKAGLGYDSELLRESVKGKIGGA